MERDSGTIHFPVQGARYLARPFFVHGPHTPNILHRSANLHTYLPPSRPLAAFRFFRFFFFSFSRLTGEGSCPSCRVRKARRRRVNAVVFTTKENWPGVETKQGRVYATTHLMATVGGRSTPQTQGIRNLEAAGMATSKPGTTAGTTSSAAAAAEAAAEAATTTTATTLTETTPRQSIGSSTRFVAVAKTPGCCAPEHQRRPRTAEGCSREVTSGATQHRPQQQRRDSAKTPGRQRQPRTVVVCRPGDAPAAETLCRRVSRARGSRTREGGGKEWPGRRGGEVGDREGIAA